MKTKQNNNWIPPKAWTTPFDTNIFKMIKLKLTGVHQKVYHQFLARALLEEEIPDLRLQTLEDGRPVRLRDFRGKKHLVLEFGALT